MSKSDRILVAGVAAVLLIAVIALILAATQPDPTYGTGTRPGDVVHNYLLAIEKREFDIALAELWPDMPNPPETAAELEIQVRDNEWIFPTESDTEIGLAVVGEEFLPGDRAVVEVQMTRFYPGGIFDSATNTSTFEMRLISTEAGWKVANGKRFFLTCWYEFERVSNPYPCGR